MSTRSGKRIHASSDENLHEIEDRVPRKSDVRTRSKKLKENVEVTSSKLKKRRHYVSYPASDESEPASEEVVTELPVEKKARKLRRYTLKEKNAVEPVTDDVEMVDSNKSTRTTRRNKRASDALETDVVANGELTGKKSKAKKNKIVVENIELPIERETKIPVPKNKKLKKKKKEAKSKKVSLKKEDQNDEEHKNKSVTSVDSFYSAAGSPVKSSPEMKEKRKLRKNSHFDEERNIFENISNDLLSSNSKSVENSKSKRISNLVQKRLNSMDVDEIDCKNVSMPNKNEKRSTEIGNSTFEKDSQLQSLHKKTKGKKKSSLLHISDVTESSINNINSTLNKADDKSIEIQNSTFDKEPEVTVRMSTRNSIGIRKSSLLKDSFNKTDVIDSTANLINTTFDKSEEKTLGIQNTTFDKSPIVSSTNSKTSLPEKVNTTFDKVSTDSKTASLNSTYDKDTPKINTTFDKAETNRDSIKSSLLSSDNSNVTLDKSNENSRISITSDDSKIENIINTTPVLIESSLDESQISQSSKKTPTQDHKTQEDKTPENKETSMLLPPATPLIREGTFTKDGPDVIMMSPKPKTSLEKTPVKTPTRKMSLPSPGCTPFYGTRSESQKKSELNVTRSIEKSRRSSLAEMVPRQTKVMFCSPVDGTTLGTQQKRKIIKSSLKGSNKSFVFDEHLASSSTMPVAATRRKRSYTADAGETSAKRSRLGSDSLSHAEPPPRLRTHSAIVKPTSQTPKAVTPSKPKSEAKLSRTKLPNFAALHRKQFERMESLDECQERKARRARHLLTPTGNVAVLERSSPRGIIEPVKTKETKRETKKSGVDTTKVGSQSTKAGAAATKSGTETTKMESETTKTEAETSKPMLPTLESLRPGFTRFGFKMNIGVNPFISPIKSASKQREIKPNGIKKDGSLFANTGKKENKSNLLNRQGTLPSLVGATSSRKEKAKHTVLREKSFSHSGKRDETRMENRTIIKGVRTNRRFELQMQMRNIN